MFRFIILFIYVVTIILTNNYAFLLVALLLNIFIAYITKINKRKMINNFIEVGIFSLFILIINLLTLDYNEAIILAAKLFLTCNIVYIFSKVLTPLQMIEALDKILSPIKVFGTDTNSIGILMCMTFAFIPIFKDEIKQVLYAMKAKCINIRIKNLYLIIAPMIATALKRTNDVELALRSKGYK